MKVSAQWLRRSLVAGSVRLLCAFLVAATLTASLVSRQPALTLRMMLLPTEEAANAAAARLAAGESFALMAVRESRSGAREGGWLGRVDLSQLRPEVQAALEGLKPGQVTRPVPTTGGYAIFKVEPDETADDAPPGDGTAVKFTYDVSGFTEARIALDEVDKAPGWNMDPRAICDARTRALAASRTAVERFLASPAAQADRDPLDLMQLVVGLGQLSAYEGRLGETVERFEQARAIAASQVPAAALQMDEAAGIAYLHKATMDNGVFAEPKDFCLLGAPGRKPLPRTGDVLRAIEAFTRYLTVKPDELEVRWLLNVAYMMSGGYPDRVPAAWLIPASTFASAEDVGRFRDVAAAAGLAAEGSAGPAIVEDFRNTGRFDVITSMAESCGPVRFHASDGAGRWEDRTDAAGLSAQFGGLNAVPGDFNNDGCQDVLLLRGGWEELPQRVSLLRNDCHGRFTDVTAESGLASAPATTQTAVWTDLDNDGFLDLFVGVENGPAQLWRNRGDGTFENVSARAGVDRPAFTKGVTAGDFDDDGYPDLYVSNYGETNFLYHNNRDWTFTEVSAAARVTGTPTGFATWFFDYDNDGRLDLFVTSYVASLDELARRALAQPRRGHTMKLYRNLGDGTFRDVSREVGLDRVMMPMGSNFGDIDNDGYLDLFFGTGNPSYGSLAGAVMLRNREGRGFVDVTASSGTGELHRGHGVAFADLDNDGDEDIVFEVGGVTPGDRHAMRVFENPGHGNDWLAVKLVGVKTTKTAIGATLTVTVTDGAGASRRVYRTVGTGSSFGSSPLLQHVGLGKDARRVDVDVWWPVSGTRQHFADVGRNRWIQVTELSNEITPLERTPARLGGGAR
jgi:hypothetical protein